MAYSAPSTAVPAPSWVSRPATTADHAAEPRLKAKIAIKTGNSPMLAGARPTRGRRSSRLRMEVVARYATNRVRTKESLHLKTVATVFKSGVMRFPDGFLWGAATAAHQIEGNNVNNDWWRAEAAGRLPHRSEVACDSWNRWAEDIALLRQIGLNAYRLSIEWARGRRGPRPVYQAALDTY